MESGDGLQHLLGGDEDGHLPAVVISSAANCGSDDRAHLIEVARGHEEGARGVPDGDGPRDDLGGLGHVQAAPGFQPAAQRHVRQPGVVRQALIGAISQLNDHRPSPSGAFPAQHSSTAGRIGRSVWIT